MYLKIDESQLEIINRVLVGKSHVENLTPQTRALGAVVLEIAGKISAGDVIVTKRIKNSGEYVEWKEAYISILDQANINASDADLIFMATANREGDGIGPIKTMRIDNSASSPLIGEQIRDSAFNLNADYIISVSHHKEGKYGIYTLIGTDDKTEADIAAEIERERIDQEIRMESVINAMIAAG